MVYLGKGSEGMHHYSKLYGVVPVFDELFFSRWDFQGGKLWGEWGGDNGSSANFFCTRCGYEELPIIDQPTVLIPTFVTF